MLPLLISDSIPAVDEDVLKKMRGMMVRNKELENDLAEMRHQLEVLKHANDSDLRGPPEPTRFVTSMIDRGGWLIGLLMFQSCSSFILSANQELLSAHPAIIYFLTMLVGAGGNAGNQAAVRVIRRIALGTISSKTLGVYLQKELYMACGLSVLLGMTGLIR